LAFPHGRHRRRRASHGPSRRLLDRQNRFVQVLPFLPSAPGPAEVCGRQRPSRLHALARQRLTYRSMAGISAASRSSHRSLSCQHRPPARPPARPRLRERPIWRNDSGPYGAGSRLLYVRRRHDLCRRHRSGVPPAHGDRPLLLPLVRLQVQHGEAGRPCQGLALPRLPHRHRCSHRHHHAGPQSGPAVGRAAPPGGHHRHKGSRDHPRSPRFRGWRVTWCSGVHISPPSLLPASSGGRLAYRQVGSRRACGRAVVGRRADVTIEWLSYLPRR
jgi:hypothetical protein